MIEPVNRTALYPGTFDPVTNGHLWVIQRVADQYDRGCIALGVNPTKSSRFTTADRLDMLSEVVAPYPNLEVGSFSGLYQVDFARMVGAKYVVRGLRNGFNFGYKTDIRLIN